MPFDGITVNSLVFELNNKILHGKVEKIYQPEKDEIFFIIRKNKENFKLLVSACPSLPKFHLVEDKKNNPLTAPAFCMLLRKHLLGSKILRIQQFSLERVVEICFECIDEMGYNVQRTLTIEIMGRHSNIILINSDDLTIIDSIKRVNSYMSSIRTVLPGDKYKYPPAKDRVDPLIITEEFFVSEIKKQSSSIMAYKYLLKKFYGLSAIMAQEICLISGIDPEIDLKGLNEATILKLYKGIHYIINKVRCSEFMPNIITEGNNKSIDFAAFDLKVYGLNKKIYYDSISKAVEFFYTEKDKLNRMKQKTGYLHKTVENRLERSIKKLDILNNELNDSRKGEYYKLCGDLIMANLYLMNKGMDKIFLPNYYTVNEETVEIKLNINFTPVQNAQSYYKKYNKSKKALSLITKQLELTMEEIQYLESVMDSIERCLDENGINEIQQELIQQGYVKKSNDKKRKKENKGQNLLHYISSSKYDIYVGKNNLQNDYLTLKYADSNDIWFHTKDIPGSHVIVKTNDKAIDESTIIEAASLAAYFSKAKLSSNVPVDYTHKKNVKKPTGAKPGKVIYDNQKTVYITPKPEVINNIKKISE